MRASLNRVNGVYCLSGSPRRGQGNTSRQRGAEVKLAHIATGDLFRQALERGTELGMAAKSYMEKGVLVPDQITIDMVLERISAPDSRGGAVFDGFPRNLKQAEALDKALARQGKAIDKAVHIEVSDEELLRRLGGRRVCRQCH